MATYVGKIKVDGTNELPIGSTLYGTCGTAAATAAKVVTCANFDKLITGVTIFVKFTYANGVANPTLNVNGTGAKNIYRFGTNAPSTAAKSSWNPGSVVAFTYDGSYWQMVGWLNDDTTYSNMSASEMSTGTATTTRLVTAQNLAACYEKKKSTATASLTVAGWSSNSQTVTVSGVTTSNTVIVSPAPASLEAYAAAGVYCSAQAANKLTFTCKTVPSAALTVNVVILA